MVDNEHIRDVPALRFPEYSDGWDEKRMDSIVDRVVNPVKVEKDKNYQEIGIRSHGKGLFHKESVTGKKLGNKRVFWIEEDVFIVNIVFAWEQAVAKTTNAEVGMIASHRFPMYKPVENVSVLDYILYFFLTNRGKYLLEMASPGGAGRNKTLGQKNFDELKIRIPSVLEQQKIAAFLISIDEKVQQLTKKKELLEKYKKGLMQKIFSQEIRFKDADGKEFPKWEYVKLGELTKKTGKKNKENIAYPIYSINNQEGFLPQAEQFEGMSSNDRGYDISLYKIIKKNTFAYNPARINVGSIGFSGDLNDIIISSLYVCFQTTDELEDLYLLQYLDTYEFNKSVLRNTEGGVRDYLFYENFSNIKIPLPSNEEQNKIVSFLSKIDIKIDLISTQLDKTKEFKKGLLQQMFV